MAECTLEKTCLILFLQLKKIEIPKKLKTEVEEPIVTKPVAEEPTTVDVTERKQKLRFWDKFKDNLIDLFKEQGDKIIR